MLCVVADVRYQPQADPGDGDHDLRGLRGAGRTRLHGRAQER